MLIETELDEETSLIRIISKAGDRYGSTLIEFLTMYGLAGLKDATAAQLREYATAHGLI